MYSENFSDIRLGFVNYIGSFLESSQLKDNKNAKHIIIAMLTEEAINLSKDSDGNIDMKSIKPLLKGIDYIANNRISSLTKSFGPEMAQNLGSDYIKCADSLNKIIKNIGGNASEGK